MEDVLFLVCWHDDEVPCMIKHELLLHSANHMLYVHAMIKRLINAKLMEVKNEILILDMCRGEE